MLYRSFFISMRFGSITNDGRQANVEFVFPAQLDRWIQSQFDESLLRIFIALADLMVADGQNVRDFGFGHFSSPSFSREHAVEWSPRRREFESSARSRSRTLVFPRRFLVCGEICARPAGWGPFRTLLFWSRFASLTARRPQTLFGALDESRRSVTFAEFLFVLQRPLLFEVECALLPIKSLRHLPLPF
jgi:hypothetical protein